ncbi:MAG: hypothetical protein ACQGVK_08925 [Myxococcota bacterium]
MDHSKALACALAVAVAVAGSGCAFVKLQLREPGHRNKDFPQPVASEYHCDKRPLPFFQFEDNELVPRRMKPGTEFNQRIVYVLCPDRPTGVVAGRLHTRVLFEGETILEEIVDQKLRPGRWILDHFIHLPEDARPGVYAMDIRFESRAGDLEDRVDFVVKEP